MKQSCTRATSASFGLLALTKDTISAHAKYFVAAYPCLQKKMVRQTSHLFKLNLLYGLRFMIFEMKLLYNLCNNTWSFYFLQNCNLEC